MAYKIEAARNINLENTEIPNVFIADILPDVPDGDYVKAYVYAFMCCRQGIWLTHSELAEKLGLPVEKVLSAWRYFAERKVVRKIPKLPGDETQFDVEFLDIKGLLYAHDNGSSTEAQQAAQNALRDEDLKSLLARVAGIVQRPTLDSDDSMKLLRWIGEWGATSDIIEGAFRYCMEKNGNTRIDYVGKVVRKWVDKGLKTAAEINEYLASTDQRFGFYKQLMEALGLKYVAITEPERKKIDLWLDEYGYTQELLLELAAKTEGKRDKYSYLEAIIRKDRAAASGSGGVASPGGESAKNMQARSRYYREAKEQNRATAAAHRDEVYARSPRIKTLDDELVALNMERVELVTSNARGKQTTWEKLGEAIRAKVEEKTALMAELGFPADYMDIKYNCKKCEDTGIVVGTGASCDCFFVNSHHE